MKKLISLLAALAVVSTCTMSAFAFSVETTDSEGKTTTTAMTVTTVDEPEVYEADEDGKYTVDASVAGTQDQTTILAVKGDVVRLGSIEYIDQSATQSFSFALRNELAAGETVNVLVGGSNGTVYNTGYMQGASESTDPEEPTTYTVSGIVTDTSGAGEFITGISDPEMGLDEETINGFKTDWATKVYLLSYDETAENLLFYMLNYFGEEIDKPTPLATADVDLSDGTYSFSDVAAGKYTLIFERAGMLPLFTYIEVTDSNYTVPSKTLINGNIVLDMSVDGYDIEEFITVFGKTFWDGHEEYTSAYDVISDGALDSYDVEEIIANFGADMTQYNEQAIIDVYTALES